MNCLDCKGSGQYVGLFNTETCLTCGGTGKAKEGDIALDGSIYYTVMRESIINKHKHKAALFNCMTECGRSVSLNEICKVVSGRKSFPFAIGDREGMEKIADIINKRSIYSQSRRYVVKCTTDSDVAEISRKEFADFYSLSQELVDSLNILYMANHFTPISIIS